MNFFCFNFLEMLFLVFCTGQRWAAELNMLTLAAVNIERKGVSGVSGAGSGSHATKHRLLRELLREFVREFS